MKATIELTNAVLQALLLTKKVSAHNGNTDTWKVIKSVSTIEVRDDGNVFCFGMINDKQSGYIFLGTKILPTLLETGTAVKEYTNKLGQPYTCEWYLKDSPKI